MLGAFRYAAPEQIVDSPEIDARADIYSLGIILEQREKVGSDWAEGSRQLLDNDN